MIQQSQSFIRTERRTSQLARRGERLARIASSIAIGTGILVLVGWQLDIDVLKSAIPGLVAMKVNTAICFILAGISLRLQTHQLPSPLRSPIIKACTSAVIIIALLTICEYLFGWNLGIDELLFRDLDTVGTVAPGRMGVNTAVNFCLIGAALWLINCQEQRSSDRPQHRVQIDRIAIAQIVSVVAASIALQAIFSYTYDVPLSTMMTSMALHTTIAFESLCVGILGLRSDRGFMRSFTTDLIGGNVARQFLPTAVVVPLAVGWLVFQGLQAKLYDPNVALSLMSISMVVIWLVQISINAGMLNRIDYDRIRSDDRMRSSQERLKLALQGARQGIWDFDLQTQELMWDDRCKEMFGLSPTAVVNYDSYLAAVYPDDRQRIADAVEIAIRDRGEFAQEYRTIHSDGTSHWILTQGCCLCDPAGEPCRMSGTMMDITERKQVQLNERFLHELTRRLRLITDADQLQDEAARSVGEYLHVDRVTWFGVDWSKRLGTIDRDWHREGLESHVGVYAIGNFLPPAAQVALFAGDSVVTTDVHTDPSFGPYVEAYQQLGIQANVWIPCFNENRWVATLTVNTVQVRSWREDEIALLQAVAAQIWPTIEQARAVQALRAQEAQTRADQATIRQQLSEIEAIYRNAPIGLCFVDTDLRYVRIDERLAQFNGASVAAHIGHTLREILPELADDLEPIYRQVIESGEPIVDLEVSGTNPAQPGILRSWISSFYPQTDAENRTIGVNTVVQEVTDRKRQEAERERVQTLLRSSERKFSAIFNQTFELMGIVSLDGVLLEINQAALDSIEVQATEIVGKKFWEAPWWHTEQLQQQVRDAIATAASGQFIRYEVEFPNPRGGMSITDFSLKPVFDEAHRVTTLLAEARDITDQQAALRERKQAEAALSEGEERFRTLADNISQLAWMANSDGGIFWYNRRWFEYTRTTLEQMQGWGWQQVHDPEHIDRVVAHFRHSIEIGAEWEDTFPLRGHDGMYRWFLSRAIPIRDDSGQIVRWFGTNTDITEQQTALREFDRSQAALKQRNQDLDSFVHVVAHDLKAPLRAVANLSQWIEDDLEGSLSVANQQQMTLLRSRVRRMGATIDELLDHARIGHTDAKIESVSVAELLAETIDSIAPPLTFAIAIAPNLPTLNTKRLCLAQVFANLISNAIKHHDRSDGSLHIFGRDLGDVYEFVIADDGPGIAPEQHDKIFEIFQAINPQNRSDSTGIGLSIVKKIIETEGGTIRLESKIGTGTTFYFTWPQQ